MTRQPQTLRSQRGGVLLWVLVSLLLVLVLGTLYLVRGPLLAALADWWVVDEPLEKAQVVVVLGGDSVTGDRVRHAVELYRHGWAPRIVLSGASLRTYFNEVELMKREAVNQGVPEDRLVLAPQTAESTLQEAQALEAVLAQHKFRRVIIVTSNYHTRRARMIFKALYQKRGTRTLVSAADDTRFRPQRWWKDREARNILLWELLATAQTWWELLDPPPAPGVCLPPQIAL